MPARARQCVIVAGMRVGIGNRCLCVDVLLLSWRKSIMWWVSDAGGTALIDPS